MYTKLVWYTRKMILFCEIHYLLQTNFHVLNHHFFRDCNIAKRSTYQWRISPKPDLDQFLSVFISNI